MKTIKIKYVDTTIKENTDYMKIGGRDFIYDCLKKHYNVEWSDDPDIVFCWFPVEKVGGKCEYSKFSCKRVQLLLESEVPDFNSFDYIISAFHNFHYYDKYLYMPASLIAGSNYETARAYDLAKRKHVFPIEGLANREFCSFTVSNGSDADDEREIMFRLLSNYKHIDSGGAFLNNIGERVCNKLEFDKKHKFSIAFENVKGSFITEKLDAAFAAQTIPIYWGNPYVGEIYNTDAFINCHDYNSFEEVVKRVIEIDNNDELYYSILKKPAFVNDKTSDEYYSDLERYLIHVVEENDNKAIIRSNKGIPKMMQDVRIVGTKWFFCVKKNKKAIKRLLALVFKPFNHTILANKLKKMFFE